MDKKRTLSFEEVRRLIPQAHPFLMVDRVADYTPGERLVAIKNVTGNEAFFQGHFPDIAVMPAALILEGMAQATILLTKLSATGADPGAIHLFGSVHAKMMKPVFPGDVLQIEVRLLKMYGDGGAAEGIASVDGVKCQEAEMYFSRVQKDALLRSRAERR